MMIPNSAGFVLDVTESLAGVGKNGTSLKHHLGFEMLPMRVAATM